MRIARSKLYLHSFSSLTAKLTTMLFLYCGVSRYDVCSIVDQLVRCIMYWYFTREASTPWTLLPEKKALSHFLIHLMTWWCSVWATNWRWREMKWVLLALLCVSSAGLLLKYFMRSWMKERKRCVLGYAVCLQVTLKEVIPCENDVATSDDFPTTESNGKEMCRYM